MAVDVLYGDEWYAATVALAGEHLVTIAFTAADEYEDIPMPDVATRIRLVKSAQVDALAPDMSIEVLFDGQWYKATVMSINNEVVSVFYEEAQDDEDLDDLETTR